MKALSLIPRFLLTLLAVALPTTRAATVFTTDTLIGVNDLTYEGQDLVVSNAVLTVDGPHAFASMRLAAGAMLTHSASGNGELPLLASVTNELHLLVDTNAVILLQPAVVLASIIVTDTNGFVIYTNEVDYVIINSGMVFTLQRTTNSIIPDGASVFISYDHQATVNTGLRLTITNDFELEPSASVNADARGFAGGVDAGGGGSSGFPLSGGGGGHGGYGGLSSSNAAGGGAHGSPFGPVTLGSRGGAGLGGNGGAGGGAIQLSVGRSGILNGTLTANGQNATNSRAGGGAGGSIRITAPTITGNGMLRANGGAGEPVHGGGGGGGRIALASATNLFIGTFSATGGAGWQHGGAGTLYVTSKSSLGKVTIDNGGFVGANTPIELANSSHALEVRGHATVGIASSASQTLRSLIVRSNSIITSFATNNATVNLSVIGDAVIELGAELLVTGKGYPADQGPGAGISGVAGSGAGHGGYGGSGISSGGAIAVGGNSYDSLTAPTQAGSGGRSVGIFPGGSGGGAVQLTVKGNLQLDGRISADATAGSGTASGGAAGGSVLLSLNRFSGAGSISANGSKGGMPSGGGGGGGRIAVTHTISTFIGTMTATGGTGAISGGAGTIYTKRNASEFADLRVDNGGLKGTNTPAGSDSGYNLVITGGAVFHPSAPALTLILGSVSVGPDSTWLLGNGAASANVSVVSNVTVAPGGLMSGDGLGYASGQGPGAATSSAGGGGHGGYGGSGVGAGSGIPRPGGNIYDSSANPTQPGSGGGGGAGGAALRLTVFGELVLDGRLSANGSNSGGAGGCVRLSLNRFSGAGQVLAEGGNGYLAYGSSGGGGGGGRIAVYWNSNSFTGTYSAKGGLGFVAGGAGTIYLKANNAPSPSLILDNGGRAGANTVLDVSPLLNLTLSSGARVVPAPNFGGNITNLYIGNASTLYVTNTTLRIGSATVAVGGAIVADGVISQGLGGGVTGGTTGSSGGGYGGYGGRGATAAAGGNAYDFAGSTATGSPGGGTSPTFGLGGGGLRLDVTGPLVVDGRISANGSGASTNASGGGSGGNLSVSAKHLSGSGIIAADGGSGALPNGGGGGGGRVSITWTSNLFTGTISAKGGPGFAAGGAGVIQIRQPSGAVPAGTLPIVIVDNGGLAGTNSLFVGPGSLLDLNVRSGAILTSTVPSLTMSNLSIGANSALLGSSMTLTVSGVAHVAAGGRLSVDGSGFPGGTGSGAAGSVFQGSGGGGHGGYGGRGAAAPGGNVYGLSASPSTAGSGGGGSAGGAGSGGGVIRLNSGSLILDGRISATGSDAAPNANGFNRGGGAGGSVWLTLNHFTGSGIVSANGGQGYLPNGGGGGGGRIAVTWNSNSFTGNHSAKGGNGFQAGGAGTIYLRPNNTQTPSLLVDNGGLPGTNTAFDLTTLSNLTIRGGAVLRATSSSTISLGSLNIANNSTLLGPPNNGTLTLSLSGPAVVEEGSSISADGQGYAGGTGTSGGAGGQGITGEGSGGGGHAGYGGRGFSPTSPGRAPGGNAYDSLANPTFAGSGGGGVNLSRGAGGGVIRITASRAPFTLDGRITANGLNAFSNSAGGGAGGSINLALDEFFGSGTITADGGNGHSPNGGGGGGGRVAIAYNFTKGNYPSNGFTGSFSAKGGAGYVNGGAGTTFIRTNNASIATVIADNGGRRGTNTLVSGTSFYDLTVKGGAGATSLGQPRDVFVRSNAWLATSPQLQSTTITVSRNATFDAGGGIDLDGLGSSQSGGSSFTTPRGGGGHGGYGGFHLGNTGNAYGSAASPSQSGSSGGNGSGSAGIGPFGGRGGGLAQMTVGGTLLLNGNISANGRDGEFNSGGGSGGGLRVQTATLAGSGSITATGGSGNGTAGGGGGGRIAIYYTTNLFTGTISACGGNGGEAGGAGTIYIRDNFRLVSSLLLDNCGLTGASTPFSAVIGLATNIFVSDGAVAEARGTIPLFSNLVATSGGKMTMHSANTDLFLGLLGNLTVAEDSAIVVDGKGFALTNGPGAGESLANQGAGGGHGGAGGASASEAIGGRTYGSPTRPVDRGSGGGMGSGFPASGSEGGGILRLAVAGTMAIDGVITANGATGVQDDAGGGAGGSIWITAGKLTGQGIIEAAGGDGELYGGGGGGGGRIAVYSPMNTFTGLVSVAGGNGAFVGETGTIFTSGSLGSLEVISQTPNGVVSNLVTEILVNFSEPLAPGSVTPDDVVLRTPRETLPPPNWTLSMPAPGILRVNFGAQNVPGDYRIEVGPNLTSLFGTPMSQVYTGGFTVVLPTISGSVTDPIGQPVAGLRLYPDGSLLSAITDATGHYSLSVPANWSGTVTPALAGFIFAPGGRSYTNLSGDVINQNYQMIASLAPSLQIADNGTNLLLHWNAYAGVTYQVLVSTNLADWLPMDPPIVGTNGLMQLVLPISGEPQKFFRVTAQN